MRDYEKEWLKEKQRQQEKRMESLEEVNRLLTIHAMEQEKEAEFYKNMAQDLLTQSVDNRLTFISNLV